MIVLAIDDTPERYQKLSELLRPHKIALVCVSHPVAVEQVMASQQVVAILLDHDMPAIDSETGKITERWNGQYFAKEVLYPGCPPIAIASANSDGVKAIAAIFTDWEIEYQILPATRTQPEKLWLDFILSRVKSS